MSALLKVLLRLFPRSFREARTDELLADLEEERARARGPSAQAAFWARTVFDLVRSALRLRLRPVPARWSRGRGGASLRLETGHALRSLAAAPGVTLTVVLILALGVGSSTAVFSVVDAVLLRPLDYQGADRLVHVAARLRAEGDLRGLFSGGDFREVREGIEALEDAAAVTDIRQNLTGAGLPRQVMVGWGSGNLFGFLGVEARVGRVFTEEDGPGTVVLTHGLWLDHFGADPGVVGRTVQLDGHPHAIVGVLPPGFRLHLSRFPAEDVELWKNPDAYWQNGDVWNAQGAEYGLFQVMGRLAPEATLERAAEQLATLAGDLRRRYPAYDRFDYHLQAVPLQEDVTAEVRPTLLLLLGAVVMVLLIACANVAGLLLVRATGRGKELALRSALGASRPGLVRLLLLESLVLALAGGVAGSLLASAGTRVLVRLGPPIPRLAEVGVDSRVLAFALGVSLLATLAAGLVPALGASRADPAHQLRGGQSSLASRAGLRNALVVGQLALSLVLLVGTILLSSSLVRLQRVEPGFDPGGVTTFAVSLPGAKYERPTGTGRFLLELEDRIRALAGVTEVGVMWPIPFSNTRWSSAYSAGEVDEGSTTLAGYRVGSAGYFGALGIPLLEGRLFREGDPRHAVVVSRRLAERAWPGESALGRTVQANPWGGGDEPFEVIGVVDDVRHLDLEEEPAGDLYFDLRGWSWTDWEFHVVVSAVGVRAADLVPRLRALVAEMDGEVPIADVATMEGRVDRALAPNRFALLLVGLFSASAGILALVGLYGVVSFAVGRRTREIGIRMALGSPRAAVAGLILRQGMGLVAMGTAAGLLAAAGTARFLRGWLYQIEPTDPLTYALAAVALGALALLATWLPARRAAREDPARVLRSD